MAPARDGFRLYLAYGSNLHPARLEARIGEFDILGACRLPGFRFRYNKRGRDGSAKANLVPQDDALAWGAVYRVPDEALAALDRFEGRGRGYERVPVEVELEDERVLAFTYLSPPDWPCAQCLPYDWYRELVVAGARHHGFPDRYRHELAAVEIRPDPDPARAEKHAALVARLEAR